MNIIHADRQEKQLRLTIAGADIDVVARVIGRYFTREEYRLEEGNPKSAIYGIGSGALRVLFGAFVKRYRFGIGVDPTDGGVLVTLAPAMSGASGGIIGWQKMKSEFARTAQNLEHALARAADDGTPTPGDSQPGPAQAYIVPMAGQPAAAGAQGAYRPYGGGAVSGGALITGAIGAFIVAASGLLSMLFIGSFGSGMMTIGRLLGAAGFTMWAVGCFNARRSAGGFSIVAGVFACIAAFVLLMGILLSGMRGDTGQTFAALGVMAPGFALIFLGIWGFTATRAMGAGLGIPAGLCGVIGGAGGVGLWVVALGGFTSRVLGSDGFEAMMLAAHGLQIVAALLLGIGMLRGKMRVPRG